MSNAVVLQLIKLLAKWLVGSAFFKDAVKAVQTWNDLKISGAQKKEGVIADLEEQGWRVTGRAMNQGIELALSYIERL
jgi:hypothetical protein